MWGCRWEESREGLTIQQEVVTLVLMFGYRDLLDEGRKVFN
jgi:hypothetical protein